MRREFENKNIQITARIFVSLSISILFSIIIFHSFNTFSVDYIDITISLSISISMFISGIGIVSISFYNSKSSDRDAHSELLLKIEKISEPIFEKFHHPRDSKIQRGSFYKFLFSRLPIKTLVFKSDIVEDEKLVHILRPYWDGVWYRPNYIPQTHNVSDRDTGVIVRFHELLVCAWESLAVIKEIEKNKLNKITISEGTNGSRWFWKAFYKASIKYRNFSDISILDGMSRDSALEIISLSISSVHYVKEELTEQQGTPDWGIISQARISVFICDYLRWISFMYQKFQLLRIENSVNRCGSISDEKFNNLLDRFDFEKTKDFQASAIQVIERGTHILGTFLFRRKLQISSVPSIFLGIFTLTYSYTLSVFLGLSDMDVVFYAIMTVYIFTLATVLECFWFLGELFLANLTN